MLKLRQATAHRRKVKIALYSESSMLGCSPSARRKEEREYSTYIVPERCDQMLMLSLWKVKRDYRKDGRREGRMGSECI